MESIITSVPTKKDNPYLKKQLINFKIYAPPKIPYKMPYYSNKQKTTNIEFSNFTKKNQQIYTYVFFILSWES